MLLVASLSAAQPRRPNVLFIAADDLRTDLGCYGSPEALTPNLDALARRGVVFERAYCQQAVCNPSRASILTGRRPDTLRVWDLRRHFRETFPAIVTLPQHFKENGYTTLGLGKLFHNESGAKPPFPFKDPPSWSEPPLFSDGPHWADWVEEAGGAPKGKGGAVQRLDVPDEAYLDGRIAAAAVRRLGELAREGRPFFLGVGFWKPHLPFNAPKRYWDLYDRSRLRPPSPPTMPAGAPALAGHTWNELRGYAGMPKDGPLSAEQIAELRHGYLAGVSFLDAQVGKVMAELGRLGLDRNTLVVFWSDHGFHLGEHDLWGKTANYELDTRVPLIFAGPGVTAGGRATGLAELLDVYPTLVEAGGLPASVGTEGRSLLPQLRDPTAPGKKLAISQHPRPAYGNKLTHMGYTLRSAAHRYVEWRELAGGAVVARELYDHRADPAETLNRIDDPALASVAREFSAEAARIIATGGGLPAARP
ncbi:MAG: sulfatase [Opitutaceae bacterium]